MSKSLQEALRGFSQTKIDKQNKWRSRYWFKSIHEPKAWQLPELSIENVFAQKRRNFDWKMAHLEQQTQSHDALFLTLTVNGWLHTGKPKDIKRAYETLTKLFTKFRKSLEKEFRYALPFIRVVEPHKDLTPHVHALLYFEKRDKNRVMKVWNRVYKRESGIDNAIGRKVGIDVKLIDNEADLSNPAKYLGKYVSKNLSDESAQWLDGYYRKYQMRQVVSSKLDIPFEYFTTIRHFLREKHKLFGLNASQIYQWAMKNVMVIHNNHRHSAFGRDDRTQIIKNAPEKPQLHIVKDMSFEHFFFKVKATQLAKVFIDEYGEAFKDSRDLERYAYNPNQEAILDTITSLVIKAPLVERKEAKLPLLDYIYTKCRRGGRISKIRDSVMSWILEKLTAWGWAS